MNLHMGTFSVHPDSIDVAYKADFVSAYIECLLWTSTDEEGTSWDSANFDVSDVAESAIEEMTADCHGFISSNAALLNAAVRAGEDAGQAGHDFCLTRNRHGAGFWDRGLGELGDKLSDSAHPYGDSNLYLGDDGLLYV